MSQSLRSVQTLNPDVVSRLVALSMDVWRPWWSAVGLPSKREFSFVEMMRMTWPEN